MTTTKDISLTIDPEFKALLPAHDDKEAEHLKAKVEQQGRFDGSILYWPHGDKNIVLDGHHRFTLWSGLPANTPIPPPVVEPVLLPDRAAAMNWMLLHQLSRRNMKPKALSILRGRLLNLEKQNDVSPTAPTKSNFGQNVQKSRPPRKGRPSDNSEAVARVAKKTGVSEKTVARDAEFVAALDAIGAVNAKAKQDIESGALKVPKKDVLAIAKLNGEIGTALGNLRNGRKWNDGIAPAKKPSRGKEISPAKMVDALKRDYVSKLVKGIDAVAKVNGGRGDAWQATDDAMNALLAALALMREGQQ